MQEIILTPSTMVLLVLILALAALAVYRIAKRGLCDCGDHCDSCGKNASDSCNGRIGGIRHECDSCSVTCKSCAAAEKMAASMSAAR